MLGRHIHVCLNSRIREKKVEFLFCLILVSLSRSLSFHTKIQNSFFSQPPKKIDKILVLSSSPKNSENGGDSSEIYDVRVYFDIALKINEEERKLGRIIFNLKNSPMLLPKLTENFIKLCTQATSSINPKCSYIGCTFQHSPQFVQGFPQYRWAHELRGNGVNAVREERIVEDPMLLRSCIHSIYGGVYYGLEYEEEKDESESYGVVLTVPLVGAYRGSTSFSIVRVAESPTEWKERLLLNSAVLGKLEKGMDVLREMASQTSAPPMISGSGML